MTTSSPIAAAPGNNHLQAQTVLSFLETEHSEKVDLIQTKMKDITDMAEGNNASGVIDLKSMNINAIMSVLPRDGYKVILIKRVEDGGWFKDFTGNRWRMDFARIGGGEGEVEVPTDNIVVDFVKNDSHEWLLTNAVAPPDPELLTFGPSRRGISCAHLVATLSNPKYMANNFQKGNISNYSIVPEQESDEVEGLIVNLGDTAVTLSTNGIMPNRDISCNTLVPMRKESTYPDIDRCGEDANTVITTFLAVSNDPAKIILGDGEESKRGDADRFADYIVSKQPIFSEYIKIFGKNRENMIISIGPDNNEHLWTKCSEHWETLINCFAEVCKLTLG
jgi:hypothetical protein